MKLKRNVLCVIFLVFAAVMSLSACHAGEPEETQPRKTVIIPKQNYVEPPYVDYSLTALPEFVEDLSQCTDPEKLYVLPNGYLYGYGQLFVPNAENQLALASDVDGNLFQGCGYQDSSRIRSALEIVEMDGSFVTGFIPVKPGDVIYFSGNCFHPEFETGHVMYSALYDANKNNLAKATMQNAAGTIFEILETNEAGYVTVAKVSGELVSWNAAYIRLTLIGTGVNQTISINKPLDEGTEMPGWVQLEKYIAGGWREEMNATIETVNGIELEDPASAVRFVFATDIHVHPDPSTSYTNSLGRVCAEVMQACQIPFFATGGDNCTQSSEYMPSVFEENMKVVLDQLTPIPQKNILLSVGNHDGATGTCEENGQTVHYRYQLNNEQRSAIFFDWQRESNENKHFDTDGTYYYLDDSATKTRYIILNSFWSQWEGNEDGFVEDVQHSFFYNHMFGPRQLTWFAGEALDMPAEYGAVIIVHFAPAAKDFEVFKGIVDAFSTRSTYEGAYAGAEEWQSTEIAVNYRYAEGEIIAVFQGHNHVDAEHDIFQNVPCINVTTTGAYWAVRDEDTVERFKGTASEFAVDVVVIDRESRIIYLTRLGAGSDREISY